MIGADIRDANWEDLRDRLRGERLDVHAALLRRGPSATRELAESMGRSEPTSIRPRVTELCQMGFARCVGRRGNEGIYEAIAIGEARAAFVARRAGLAEQRLLPLEA